MCLSVSMFFAKRHVAKKDITVYKVVKQYAWPDKLYAYFYGGYYYLLGQVQTSKLSYPAKWGHIFVRGEIHEGFHSITTWDQARRLYKWFQNNHGVDERLVIARCTIPKGASYYTGTWEAYAGLASDQLRVDEVIPKELY